MKQYLLLLLFLVIASTSYSQSLTDEETKLYNLIMEYRKANGLPNIPISPSLTIVAQTHVKDLQNNHPENEPCNMHSWSAKGNWTPCCYTPDHAQAQCMWDKPRELTSYKGNGFEIAHWSSDNATAEGALDSWKNSSGHNAVILNQGIWNSSTWNAIGIGIYENYAVVWFGEEKDQESKLNNQTQINMESVSPNIFVKDIKETIAFYEILGFKVNAAVPDEENPIFILMTCGSTTFMFQTFASLGNDLPQIKRQDGGSLLLYIQLKSIRAFYEKIKDKVTVLKGLEKTFYGATEFSIIDNNNYILTFAEDEK